ncbi:MAG: ABC transporter ATP-binding protein [Candidatus Odinarchaeota archaeon]|nr:ABC transporter ATP-binding protein [Candidatus Odinarchaeota archaeon]
MGREVVVETIDLCKVYRMGLTEIHALKNVNLKVYRGEMVAVVGPSGSGKTTLLNLIGTLDKPTSGKIYIDGEDITTKSEKELTLLRRRKIGFVFQFYNLIPVLTAYENVELPLLISGVPKKEREERVRRLLEMVGLEDRMNHRPDELSGGEQQRVAIARALVNNPSIILADEPTGDLDTETGLMVVQLMRKLAKEEDSTVIMVTHDPQISEIADRIIYLRDGRIIGEHKSDD